MRFGTQWPPFHLFDLGWYRRWLTLIHLIHLMKERALIRSLCIARVGLLPSLFWKFAPFFFDFCLNLDCMHQPQVVRRQSSSSRCSDVCWTLAAFVCGSLSRFSKALSTQFDPRFKPRQSAWNAFGAEGWCCRALDWWRLQPKKCHYTSNGVESGGERWSCNSRKCRHDPELASFFLSGGWWGETMQPPTSLLWAFYVRYRVWLYRKPPFAKAPPGSCTALCENVVELTPELFVIAQRSALGVLV